MMTTNELRKKFLDFFKKNVWVGVAGGIILFLLVIAGGYYNSFVSQNNAVTGQCQQVEVQYQRRFDLIPNLVGAAKGLDRKSVV